MTEWGKIIVGTGLLLFAVIPDPTDITIIIPAAAASAGIGLIVSGVGGK